MLNFSEVTARNLTEILEDKDITSIEYNSGYPHIITYSNGYKAVLSYSGTKLSQANYYDPSDTLVNRVRITYSGEQIDRVIIEWSVRNAHMK